jgi:Pentapeptide repeats (9 copies)/Pentapeptide repeats (8 copies)
MGIKSFKYTLLSIILLAAAQHCSAQQSEVKQPITESEFLKLFKEGEDISDRDIPGDFIIDALRWVQEQASGTHKGPEVNMLRIINSDIKGSLDFESLHKTDVKDLTPELRRPYERINAKEVNVIPIWLSIINSTFERPFSFNDTVFLEVVDFSGTSIPSANFRNVIFKNVAGFHKTIFGGADFTNSTFLLRGYFWETTFKYKVFFDDSEFQREAIFTNSSFEQMASFREVIFQDSLVFTKVKAPGFVSFEKSIFQNGAFFMNLNTSSSSSLHEGVFDLSEAMFSGRVNFTSEKAIHSSRSI